MLGLMVVDWKFQDVKKIPFYDSSSNGILILILFFYFFFLSNSIIC